MSLRAPLNFSKNLEKVFLSKRCSSSCRKIFVFFASVVSELSLSSKNWPYRATVFKISNFCPGMISLKVFAWPKVILSKCLICFLLVTFKPLTKSLLSWKGMIKIYPFSWMIAQCFFMIPNALSLMSFYSDSFVPIFISPSFNLYINMPASVGSSEIFIRYGNLS